jgi:hypothetical protein
MHGDLTALRESLRALRNVDGRAVGPGGPLATPSDVPALRLRPRPWPRWHERLELTDEDKSNIEKRRLP